MRDLMYIEFSKAQVKKLLKDYIENYGDSCEVKLSKAQVDLILETHREELPTTNAFAQYIKALVKRYAEWQGSDVKALLADLDRKHNIHR